MLCHDRLFLNQIGRFFMNKNLVERRAITGRIHMIRGISVMLDRDLAELYDVTTGNLNKAVKRNLDRFPEDFMFQLTGNESENYSRFQNGSLNSRGKNIKYLPYAFTEQGIAMLSSVLKNKLAAQINIRIMRAFIDIRQAIAVQPEYEQLKSRVHQIESQVAVINAHTLVGDVMIEKKLMSMSEDIRRISETLDQFQEAYVVIKRPDEEIKG